MRRPRLPARVCHARLRAAQGMGEGPMNSYWVEHQATHHVADLIAGADGDQLVRQAEAAESATPDPRPATWRQTVQRVLVSLQATARRSHRRATQLR